MPRTGQIIPEWIQPHEAVYINDNTFFEDYTADNSGPTFLCVFTSPKGRNQLQLKNLSQISSMNMVYQIIKLTAKQCTCHM